jgi:SAM-dependent methyltransferase
MALYDSIGKNYAQSRRSDPRIVAALLDVLKSSPISTVVDVGTGTGSYALALAEHGYRVLAVEPSATMRSQAIAHPKIEWMEGVAEQLPLPSEAAEAAIVMLAFHHFQDSRQALREMHRVVGKGAIVLFTYDPMMISRFWLTEYFPAFVKDVESTFLPLPQLTHEIQSVTGKTVNATPFPLPYDLSDSFAAVGWGRPELYLDSKIRNGISSFAKADKNEVKEGVIRLRQDLKFGRWDGKYGFLRQIERYDVGYRFISSCVNVP